MNARDVIAEVKKLGVTLAIEEGRVVAYPAELLTDKLAYAIAYRRNGILRELGDVDRPSPLSEHLHEYHDRLTSGNPKAGYVATGWTDLDFLLDGTGPGYLTVIAARPKMGKSAFGQKLACNIAVNSGPVLFFSFEMEGIELALRQVCQQLLVPKVAHEAGHVERILRHPPAIWVYERGRGLKEVVRRIRAFRLQHPTAAAVFIDQLGHLVSDVRRKERRDELTEVLATLKATASEERLPIFGMHQINRGTDQRTDRRPVLSDLKDSGSFEEYANQVVLLYRPGYYSGSDDDRTVEVNVAANRMGPTGLVKLQWHPNLMAFGELK